MKVPVPRTDVLPCYTDRIFKGFLSICRQKLETKYGKWPPSKYFSPFTTVSSYSELYDICTRNNVIEQPTNQ